MMVSDTSLRKAISNRYGELVNNVLILSFYKHSHFRHTTASLLPTYLQVIIVIRQGHGGSLFHILLVLVHQFSINLHFRRSKSRGFDEFQLGVTRQLSSQPQEGLFELVVRLGRNVVVLKVLLSVESDGLGLDLSFLDVDLVTAQHNGDVFANSHQVPVPVGHILVGDSRGDIEHDNPTLTVDVVTISQPTKLFLPGSVPHVKVDLTEVGVKAKGVHFDPQGGNVLLFKFTSQVSLDVGLYVSQFDWYIGFTYGLTGTTVTTQHKLERRHFLVRHIAIELFGSKNLLVCCAPSEMRCMQAAVSPDQDSKLDEGRGREEE